MVKLFFPCHGKPAFLVLFSEAFMTIVSLRENVPSFPRSSLSCYASAPEIPLASEPTSMLPPRCFPHHLICSLNCIPCTLTLPKTHASWQTVWAKLEENAKSWWLEKNVQSNEPTHLSCSFLPFYLHFPDFCHQLVLFIYIFMVIILST